MARCIHKILVIGLGMVGELAARLLHQNGYQVTGLDRNRTDADYPFPFLVEDVRDKSRILSAMEQNDAVLTCLPYHVNLEVARAANEAGRHYFDLTEDVSNTEEIRAFSQTSRSLMAPQCGLAPGFISIVGADLTRRFEKLRSIELRVGALPQHPRGLLGYAFNWSPEGVVNEYLNDCDVIKDGHRAKVTSMEDLETIVIDGVQLEAFTTSGGLGTICETFEGKVDKLNYKTVRYPGHCSLMRFFFNELFMRDRREEAGQILVNSKPPVKEDVVYVHAAVEGWQGRKLSREEFVRSYYPRVIDGKEWKAIAWTTASSVCATITLVAEGKVKNRGFLKQEEISLEEFLGTPTGSNFSIRPHG
ncbi:MAG: L-lysine dehydrogenase [Nitrospinae bacterium CG11_big_fil_rev_8_21_14_0_20_56_8]|nr:MAG: L-lysine dehydrogenase [Nitrospinae bacterium CG11_big_fil_rev_8_21_14_0_20_56_8]